ncbi:MAG: hypothetical protein Q8Q37_00975 [bacterium]|nr:hypothetical protein [bacterium]
MKLLATILILTSASVATLGFINMPDHETNASTCFTAIMLAGHCSGDILSFVSYHIAALQKISGANIGLAGFLFILLSAMAIISLYGTLPVIGTITNKRIAKIRLTSPILSTQNTHWLAIHENSPNTI